MNKTTGIISTRDITTHGRLRIKFSTMKCFPKKKDESGSDIYDTNNFIDVIYGLFKYSDAVINNDNYNKKEKTGNYLVSGGEKEETHNDNNELINYLYRMTNKECNVELQNLFGRQVVAKFGKYVEKVLQSKIKFV